MEVLYSIVHLVQHEKLKIPVVVQSTKPYVSGGLQYMPVSQRSWF